MNESESKDEVVIDIDSNSLDLGNHFNSEFCQAYVESSSLSLSNNIDTINLHNKQNVHRHNSKCFITEVFLHGISFILQRRVHNASPNMLTVKRIESISSGDDGYVENGITSLQWSLTSDRGRIASSGTSSEGFHELETPIRTESHLDNILHRLSDSLRTSVCESCLSLPKFSGKFYKSLEHVLVYFQDKYHSCQWLDASAAQLTEAELSDAREELCRVYESMFNDRINWGRIVAMIGFVGELSVCALSGDRLELIEEYVATSVCYVHEHIMTWIVDHGGWEGLVDFQTGQSTDGADLDHMFGTLGRLAGVAALALAGVVICKFVADHI